MAMALVCRKKSPDETWRECCERYASEYGLQVEALEIFDREVAAGEEDEGQACWNALCEWDLLDCEDRD
jgi:hypothetical protein